jgi:hypothetical protein
MTSYGSVQYGVRKNSLRATTLYLEAFQLKFIQGGYEPIKFQDS